MGALAILCSLGAAASPLDDPALAGSAVFTGPTQPHATSIFINPAALALASRGEHLLLAASTRLSQLSVDRDVVQADGSVTSGPSVSSNVLSPGGLFAFDFGITDKWRLGLSLHTPIARRFHGADDLRYHSLGGYSYQLTGSSSVSFAAHERILFGVGISIGYSALGLDFARDTALEGGTPGVESDCGGSPCGVENPLADEIYRIRAKTSGLGELVSAKNLGVIGGAMVRVTDTWWLALSLALPPGSISGTIDLAGDVTVTRAPRDGGGTLRGDAEIIFDNPLAVYLGARGPINDKLDLVTHLRWRNLSVQNRFDVRMFGGNLEDGAVPTWYPRYRGFADTLTAVVGVETPDTERVRFGGRLVLDSAAVTTADVSPMQPEPWSLSGNGGVDLRLGDHLVLTGVYGLSVFLPVSPSDSAYDPLDRIRCVDQDFDLDACAPAREGRALPTAAGSYRRFEHSLLFSLRYDTL